MNRKIRVGAVSYLNTKPLIYGFEKGMMENEVDLLVDYPSKIAAMLKNDEIDVGLVPVAVIPELKEHYIISDYCIGSDGEVASVCLFSEVPLNEIEIILLDYQSRTSVELLKILIKNYWKIKSDIKNTSEDYRNEIEGTTAGLIIGDRALEQRQKSKYIYDLSEEWKKYTGLPFVFAAWVANKKLPKDFIKNFNKANEAGLQNLNEVIKENPFELFDLKKYYTDYISYDMDEQKNKGMQLFLKKLKK